MLELEIWKDVKNYEGFYQVSNLGNIKSFYGVVNLMKYKIDKDGYFHVGLSKNKKQKTFRVHRVVAEAFIDNPNKFPEVNHKDFNKQNNKVNNLEWIDSRKNKHHYHKDVNNNTGIYLVGKTYKASFTVNRKQYYIGTFKTYKEAKIAYDEALTLKDNVDDLLILIKKNLVKHKRKAIQHINTNQVFYLK